MMAGDLLWLGLAFTPTTTPAAYHLPNRTAALLGAQASAPFRVYTFDAAEYDIKFKEHLSFRAFGAGDPAAQLALRETLIPNANVVEGIDSAGNFEPLLYRRYKQLMDAVNQMDLQTALRLLGMMNVAYILQPGELAGMERVDDGSLPTRVYRNPFALPRAWLVGRARCVPSGDEALETIRRPEFDPRREVILEGCSSAQTSEVSKISEVSADLRDLPIALHYRPNGVTIRANVPAAGYLVLADTSYPGWKATVQGKAAQIWSANFAFRAVAVEAGEQVIDFRYTPASVTLGGSVSGAALAGLVIGLVIRARRRHNSQGDSQPHERGGDSAHVQ